MSATHTKADRTSWPDGPWQAEPDRKEWRDSATGLPCLAVRNHLLGHWCGYVGVPQGHPDFGKSDEQVGYDVHGGITYAAECHGNVCHVPQPGEGEVYWFGFDCAHLGDYSPDDAGRGHTYGTYKDLSFVERECARLAAQLAP